MATIVQGILNPYDGVAQYKENIADLLDAIDRREVPLLNMLGWSLEANAQRGANSLKYPCTQQTHVWQNDQLIPSSGTLNASYATGAGAMTLNTGEGAYLDTDEIIYLTSGANTAHYRVTGISGDSINVELVAGSTDAAFPNGTGWQALGRPAIRGEAYATQGRTVAVTTDTNYTQILGGGLEGAVAVSGTEMSTAAYGITDRVNFEVAKKLAELAIKLERIAIMGIRSQTAITANQQPASRMGGMYYYTAIASGGLTRNAGGAQLTTSEAQVRGALDDIWNLGGDPSILMMNTFNRSQFSDFLQPYVRTTRDENVYGIIVNEYEYSHGKLKVMLNKWCEPSHLWVLSPEYIGIGPLSGNGNSREFAVETLPKDGDYERRNVIGELTMEVRNRQRAHALIFNLATS